MGIFNRKINKNAKNQSIAVRDFYPSSEGLISNNGTAFACIDRISSEFAGLHFNIYDAKTHQKIRTSSTKLEHIAALQLLKVLKEPNLEDRHYNFFYQSCIDYYNGGVFWLKVMSDGYVVSLFRLNPSQVIINRDENNRRIYCYNGKQYTSDQILYIPSRFDFSTLRGGRSIFDAASSVFQTAQSIEGFTQASFSNGLLGKRMVIDVAGAFPDLTAEQAEQIKQKFQHEYSGAKNAFRPLLKQKGIEYSDIGSGTDNNASQLYDNRKYQEHEIAKIFGVPEEILTNTTSANIENTFVMFNEFALRPIASQFEEAINSLLDEDLFYFEFDYNSVMKVSLASRIDAYTKQINNGMLSLDEVRAKENLSPIEAGDTHFMPANMMPWNEETKKAYMAKQKNEANANPTDPDAQHFVGGDDKQ